MALFSYYNRPYYLQNQLDEDDFLHPAVIAKVLRPYYRQWKSLASEKDSGSTVSYNKDNFLANLDVKQFKPEEISVKITDGNMITVTGKHEEKEDEHGYISRQFVRRYVLPKNYDVNKVKSELSSDGVLSISAPKLQQDKQSEKEISIVQTGQPAKAVEEKKKPAEAK